MIRITPVYLTIGIGGHTHILVLGQLIDSLLIFISNLNIVNIGSKSINSKLSTQNRKPPHPITPNLHPMGSIFFVLQEYLKCERSLKTPHLGYRITTHCNKVGVGFDYDQLLPGMID